MDNSYDVYLTGELLAGSSETIAIAGLVELFALEESDARRLVDGKRRRVKTDCDKGAALKYRERLQAIGIEVSIERRQASVTSESDQPPLAAARPDKIGKSAQFESRDLGDKTVMYEPSSPEPPGSDSGLSIAPLGSRLSEESAEQLHTPAAAEFSLADAGGLIPSVPVTPETIDPKTDHLSLVQDSSEDSRDA